MSKKQKNKNESKGFNSAFVDFFNSLEHQRYKAKEIEQAPQTSQAEAPAQAPVETETKPVPVVEAEGKGKGKNKGKK